MRKCAVSQIKVDQVLIRHPYLIRKLLEICHSILVQPDSNRLFQILNIRVAAAAHLRKIIMCSHLISSNIRFLHLFRLFSLILSLSRRYSSYSNGRQPELLFLCSSQALQICLHLRNGPGQSTE